MCFFLWNLGCCFGKHVYFFKVFFWKLVPSPWESIFAKMCKCKKKTQKIFFKKSYTKSLQNSNALIIQLPIALRVLVYKDQS